MGTSKPDFAALFREHYPRVYRYVRYRVDDDHEAEDLTAEVFERAFRYKDTYDPARSQFSTWVTQIAHNWVNNYLVSRSRHGQHEADMGDEGMEFIAAAEPAPESHAIRQEAVQRLLICVERLAARSRQIIALRFGSDMRNKDIAETLGIKEHTVSVIILRALERLRVCQEEA